MIGKKIIESEPIQSVKVKEALEEFSQENELNYEQNITLNHLSRFKRYSVEDSEKIISELEDKIGLRHKVAVRIVDLIPQDLSDLRLIFAKILVSVFCGPNRFQQLRYCWRGLLDGINGISGKCSIS